MTTESKKRVKRLAEHTFVYGCIAIILFGGSFLYWYNYIDGISMNKTYTFRDGVDPENLKTVKNEYHRNELVEFETSFCKNRDAKVVLQWTIINHLMVDFAPGQPTQLPTGCYPDDGQVRTAKTQLVPSDAMYGPHYFVGVATITFPDGRVRTQNYRTQTFEVVPW